MLFRSPRTGLQGALDPLGALQAERIVYVSCSPATLATDLKQLVEVHGYHLEAAGIADMFAHTSHVESVAVLRRGEPAELEKLRLAQAEGPPEKST